MTEYTTDSHLNANCIRIAEFWSSADLTGNQTSPAYRADLGMFWSSADLTGNQTSERLPGFCQAFWSSADLTGNQTDQVQGEHGVLFWSSADLTGNQTYGQVWALAPLDWQMRERRSWPPSGRSHGWEYHRLYSSSPNLIHQV